jgi:hypothetical protein
MSDDDVPMANQPETEANKRPRTDNLAGVNLLPRSNLPGLRPPQDLELPRGPQQPQPQPRAQPMQRQGQSAAGAADRAAPTKPPLQRQQQAALQQTRASQPPSCRACSSPSPKARLWILATKTERAMTWMSPAGFAESAASPAGSPTAPASQIAGSVSRSHLCDRDDSGESLPNPNPDPGLRLLPAVFLSLPSLLLYTETLPKLSGWLSGASLLLVFHCY